MPDGSGSHGPFFSTSVKCVNYKIKKNNQKDVCVSNVIFQSVSKITGCRLVKWFNNCITHFYRSFWTEKPRKSEQVTRNADTSPAEPDIHQSSQRSGPLSSSPDDHLQP